MSEEHNQDEVRRVIMRDEHSEGTHSWLEARIEHDGTLILEGQDLGAAARDFWGTDEYEYKLIVDPWWKNCLLLFFIRDFFKTSSELIEWLKKNNIEHRFYNRAGD